MTKINENTTTNGSPGTKGYTGYVPTEKYASYKSRLAKIIKKTTGYNLIDLEPIDPDTIDVNDNEINKNDITDINIATDKRHNRKKQYGHPNEESHKILADKLLDFIQNNL